MITINVKKIPFKLSLFGNALELELRKRNKGDQMFLHDNLGIVDAGLENFCKLVYRFMPNNSRDILRNEIKIPDDILSEHGMEKSAIFGDWYVLYFYLIASEKDDENKANIESINVVIKKAFPELFEDCPKKKHKMEQLEKK